MNHNWRKTLKALIDERGFNMKSLSKAAGRSESFVSDILKKNAVPSVEGMAGLAQVLGVPMAAIMEPWVVSYQVVRVIGAVSAGEAWEPAEDVLGEIELRADDGEPIALEVRGDSMAPVYRNGEFLIGAKRYSGQMERLAGRDCILMTEDGSRYVKFLMRSSVRGRFDLRSYNPAYEDIRNQLIAWAAPIEWVRRRHG